MKVKFKIDSPLGGYNERTVELQSNISKEDIKAMYLTLFGVSNSFCSYEIIQEGD